MAWMSIGFFRPLMCFSSLLFHERLLNLPWILFFEIVAQYLVLFLFFELLAAIIKNVLRISENVLRRNFSVKKKFDDCIKSEIYYLSI